ncbi:MAG: aldo/keto reductase [Hyphomicrobiales bacterium]
MIRPVRLPGTELEASCLGFGCASLGSRISARAGLAALARAHEAGVTWFDVAPAYGAGEAEGILGRFLAGRREGVSILTKAGLAPPSARPLLRAAYAAARPLLGLARGLRKRARQIRATSNRALDITPDLVERSIARSLTRLGTDHVEVLALHDPDPRTVEDDAVIRALERVVARGQARHVGVAGGLEACLSGTRTGLPYTFFQVAVRPGTNDLAAIRDRAGRPVSVIGHSVLGVVGAKEAIVTRLREDAAARQALAAAGYDADDLETSVATLLLDAALAANPTGVTLVSMFQASHLAQNVARAGLPLREGSIAVLRKLAAASGSSSS